MTKPLVGIKFKKFRDWILNLSPLSDSRSVLEDKDNVIKPKCDSKVNKSEYVNMRNTTKVTRSPFKEIPNKKNTLGRRGVTMNKPLTYLEAVKGNRFKSPPNSNIPGLLKSKGLGNQLRNDISVG